MNTQLSEIATAANNNRTTLDIAMFVLWQDPYDANILIGYKVWLTNHIAKR
jgi:hypothetical protein